MPDTITGAAGMLRSKVGGAAAQLVWAALPAVHATCCGCRASLLAHVSTRTTLEGMELAAPLSAYTVIAYRLPAV